MDEDEIIKDASSALLSCINNAGEFLVSADVLIKQERYRESFILTMYACEEIGKIPLILNYPIHSESDTLLKKWKGRFLDHTEKFWFLRNIDELEKGYIPTEKKEEDVMLKNKRMEICYVDYRNNRFCTPGLVTRFEAEDFFQQVNKKYMNMKERHPSLSAVRDQMVQVKKLPRDPKKLMELLMSKGFTGEKI